MTIDEQLRAQDAPTVRPQPVPHKIGTETMTTKFNRKGWGPLAYVGAGLDDCSQAYQTDGDFGVIGSPAEGWCVCYADDGLPIANARYYSTVTQAANAADKEQKARES